MVLYLFACPKIHISKDKLKIKEGDRTFWILVNESVICLLLFLYFVLRFPSKHTRDYLNRINEGELKNLSSSFKCPQKDPSLYKYK